MIDEQAQSSRIAVARLIALSAVLFSTAVPRLWWHVPRLWINLDPLYAEAVVILTALVAVLCLCNGAHPLLGLRATSQQGPAYWLRIAGLFAAIVVAVAAVAATVFYLAGWQIPIPRLDPQEVPDRAFIMLVSAPITEEVVFRSLLTLAVLPTLGERWTIIVSGLAFALVHILRGNPGPDNLIAGFLLQWAFLRSGTIVVPIAFHAGGNLIALVGHVATWYVLGPVR
jgi:membrane protease YdiL (CAAX protease family)